MADCPHVEARLARVIVLDSKDSYSPSLVMSNLKILIVSVRA